ncbi:MAG TPA: SRPBCC family protein [Tepidisphaeraceae bacterium]|nr:SRPBCC family protein [Tepidisphaeraceae bacterium]
MITLADRITPHSHPPINQPQRQRIANMGLIDRAATGVLGAGLIGLGITRRTLPSLIASIAGGGALLAMAAAGYCPIYDVFGINNARKGTAEPADYYDEGIHVEVNYTIAKSPQELFQFWRNFENLPKFMHHLKAVICKSPTRSHWIARGPAGIDVEWDAEIINEEPNRLISWRTVGEADVDSAGTVRFLPDGPGTQVHVNLDYIPPAGRVGMAIAKIFSEEPEQQIREDLQRFKQLMETGEIPTTAGQSGGLCK